ncbi:MAG: 3-hydroxyacyl-ACP dehydratase FabZ [Nitrospirota bacterium]
MLDIKQIQEILPHRYPFLFVDRIIEMEKGKRIVGIKNVTANESFFQGHFPGNPIMPGVIVIEAMAQVAGVLMLSEPQHAGKMVYFTGIDKVRFRKVVTPGDQLRFEVVPLKVRSNVGVMEGKTYVDNNLVAEATMMFMIGEGVSR